MVAAALTGIQVGASIVATRYVIDQTDPASLALLRYLIGLACLVPALLLRGSVHIARPDLAPIALLGIGQFGVLIALLNLGLRSIPAARGALLFATFPLLTMLLAAALGHERLTWGKSAGVLLTIVGVGVALAGDAGWGARAIGRGDLAVLASAVVGAVCSVLYRPYLRRYPALPVSTVAMLAAVAFLTIPAAIEGFFGDARPRLDLGEWLIVLAIGLGSGAGYLLWLWALGRIAATNVTVFLALSPLTATLLGALLLGESISLALGSGLLAVIAGLWLARDPNPPRLVPAPGSTP